MLKRLTGTAVAGLLVIGTMGALASPPGAAVESAPEPATSAIEAASEPDASAQPPAAPEFDSATPTPASITVAWTWGSDSPAPEGVTRIIVRAEPGGHELEVPGTELSATLTELEPDTEYSVTLLSAAGDLISAPSDAFTVTTLAAVDTGSEVVDAAAARPVATPGDITSLIVTLNDNAQATASAEAATQTLPVSGVEVDGAAEIGAGNVRVDLTDGVSDSDAALIMDEIASDPRVESVVIDQRMTRTVFPSTPPNDPYWTSNSLWGLYGSYGIGIGSDRLTMNGVWGSSQGSGTVIAVLDTGSTAHPDLAANYVAGYDFVDDRPGYCRTGASSSDGDYINTSTYGALGWDSNPLDPGDWTTVSSEDCGSASNSSWHGTHVAGTAAAVGNNSTGVIGVAPQAQIQPVRVLSYDGGYTSDIIAGITWASGGSVTDSGGNPVPANATPADVINLSLGGSGSCSAAWQSAITAAVNRGTVVVVSAGNSTSDAAYYTPASCNDVITVASSTSTGTLSSFSNYGSTVEITAPGSGIWSTMNSGTTTPGTATYTSYSGTSMAAPHVAGVAALLRSADNTRTPAQILSIIQSSASCFPVTGSWYDGNTSIAGAGLLRAAAITYPSICATSPQTGPIAGGTSVTLTGINMGTATAVTFDGSAATITAQTSTTVTVTSPAHAAGAVDIVVTNPNGSGTSTDAFRYFDPPTATSLSVSSGSTAGGTTVIITGTDLAPNDVQDTQWISVSFGGSAATVWLPGTTSVQVTTPAHAAGTVDVVVTTPGGSSTLPNAFTFVAPPAPPPSGGGGSSSSSSDSGGGGALQEITEVRPAFGPVSGGNLVAIIGYGFTGATSVTIGGQAAAFRVINDATVEVTMPAAAAPGSADVAVNLTAARGRAFAPGGYVYRADLPAATAPAPAPGGAATPPTPPPAASEAGSGDFVTFRADSAALTAATKAKLRKLATTMGGDASTGMVMTFSDARSTPRSTAVARQRARNIVNYLKSSGVTADLVSEVTRGTTANLRKGAIVRLSADTTATSAEDRVSSLIVRYTKGTSPTVNGAVRGANLITGGLGAGMTLGPNLGLRMYRVDFANPVTLAQAEKAAAQMSKDKGIEFAEPDRIVRATISAG